MCNLAPFALAVFNKATSRLTLIVGSEIPGDSQIDVVVPSTVGVRLPALGVLKKNIMLTTDAQAGSIHAPGQTVENLPYVGSFGSSTGLTYSPVSAGSASQITLKFAAEMTIKGGDVVSVFLPSFIRDSASSRSSRSDSSHCRCSLSAAVLP